MAFHTIHALAGGLALLFCSAAALAESPAAQARMQAAPAAHTPAAAVPFITGGIGDEERTAIEAVKKDYNLHVLSAGADGAFTGTMRLRILDAGGVMLLEAEAGPLLYARLPAGSYTVEGTYHGTTRSHQVRITEASPRSVHFIWK